MDQKEQDKFCRRHGLKKYHLLMQVEYGGHPISEKGFAIDLRGELEVCVFARSEKEAEGIAYNSYKSACRDVSYVELDCEDKARQASEEESEDIIADGEGFLPKGTNVTKWIANQETGGTKNMNDEKKAKDYEQARNELWEMLEIWVEKLGPLAGILLMETAVCIWVGIEGEDKTRQAFDGLLAMQVGKKTLRSLACGKNQTH